MYEGVTCFMHMHIYLHVYICKITMPNCFTVAMQGPDISLELQVSNHKGIISKIAGSLGGPDKAQQHLNKCLYYMNIGSNDYINNYFLPNYYPTSRTYTPEQYAEALIQQYSLQIRVYIYIHYNFNFFAHLQKDSLTYS